MIVLEEIKVLSEVTNDQSVVVVKVYFHNGDKVKKGDTLIDISTYKAVFSLEAEKDGYVEYCCVEQQSVAVNAVIARIYDQPGKLSPVKAPVRALSGDADALETGESLDSPEVLRSKLSDMENLDTLTFKKISRFKQMEIDSLSQVQSGHLGCCLSIFVDTSNILKFAERHFDIFRDSLLPCIIFEASRLLKKFPELNAFFIDGQIAFYPSVNIGMAMDLDNGLKVLKLPDMNKMALKDVEGAVLKAVDKYLDRKITKDDVTGITFTVTDISKQGLAFYSPLIPHRQSAILGMGAIDETLKRCILMLTFDHRVTDGKLAGRFLQELKKKLESYHDAESSADHQEEQCCFRCLVTLAEIRKNQGAGLLKLLNCDGQEKYICETCFAGF